MLITDTGAVDPQIRYATTSDGVSIACYAIGAGPPIVWARLPISHLQAELQDVETKRTYEAISSLMTLVRYDHRGFGLSDRNVLSFTLDELASDLAAVVERLQIGRFVLLTYGSAAPMALTYAATHPEQVSHLVLYPGFARPEGLAWKQWQALADVASDDWSFASEAMARTIFGWDDDEASRADALLLRSAVSPQSLARMLRDAQAWDATASAAEVRAPTLVLEAALTSSWTLEPARRLTALMPDARLVIVDAPDVEERRRQTFSAVAALIGGDPAVAAQATRAAGRGGETAVILFTDIADSTALTEQIGDNAFRTASRRLDDHLRAAIRDAGGTPVEGKVLGDGVMGVFASATQAIDAARRCAAASVGGELRLHIGLHAGDVIHEKDNVYGGAVNIASRICGLCAPGEILVSGTVRELARTSAGVAFEDRGEHALKGIEDPVRVFAIRAESG
jgi:class 3 adenylate cyclase/pimeloyl-ACP methyl ester carboxylesterase